MPDHSWLSKTRSRLPAEVHEHVFAWVLKLIAARGLVKGERIGVDASTMEANAALRTIVRRDTGETYRKMLKRMAKESGIETPSAEDLIRLDRARKGKTLSNEDWVSATDAEAKIAKMKDGTTHLAYKPASAVDLDTGAVVAAEVHPADEGDTTTLPGTLKAAAANLAKVGKAAMRKRAEIVERSFAHTLERGGMRRTWLRGRENVHKRYLIHVAGHNLGILMRQLIGAGTPKEAADRGRVLFFVVYTAETLAIVLLAVAAPGGEDSGGCLILAITPEPA